MTKRPVSLTEALDLRPRTPPAGMNLDDLLKWSNAKHARLLADFQDRMELIVFSFAPPPADDEIRPGVLIAKTEAQNPPPGMNLADQIVWLVAEQARVCRETLEQLVASFDLRRGATRH